MGRPGLTRHRKFARLARHLDSEALARGHLEILWDVAYENGDDLLGDGQDVEALAKWRGKKGKLLRALLDSGFVEEADADGRRYRVHDLWDHAPDYVRKRRQREQQRRVSGAALRDEADVHSEAVSRRGSAGPKRSSDDDDAETRRKPRRPRTADRTLTGHCPPNGKTPAPAPAPALEASPFTVSDHRGNGTPAGASPEGLFHSLFKLHPAWDPVRRDLTTPAAAALDAEALRLCAALLSETPEGAALPADAGDRAGALIRAHARRA